MTPSDDALEKYSNGAASPNGVDVPPMAVTSPKSTSSVRRKPPPNAPTSAAATFQRVRVRLLPRNVGSAVALQLRRISKTLSRALAAGAFASGFFLAVLLKLSLMRHVSSFGI
jgi:hypothetical protein